MTAPAEMKMTAGVKKYVCDIITGGDCPLFFPVSAVREEEIDGEFKVFFFTDGYVPLSDVAVDSPFFGARILSALVQAVKDGENYYISPLDYVINEETVFIKIKGESIRIKMIFKVPTPEEKADNPWKRVTDHLLERQLADYPEYMSEVRNILSAGTGYRNAWRRLELFKRKLYAL